MTVHSLGWETLRRQRSYHPIDACRRSVYVNDWKRESGLKAGRYVRHVPTGCLLRIEGIAPPHKVYLVSGPHFDGIAELAKEAIRILEA
jgi:hypothetical protein